MIWEEKIHIALYYRRKFVHNYIGGEHIFVIQMGIHFKLPVQKQNVSNTQSCLDNSLKKT